LTKSLTADADGAWSYDLTAADVTAMGEGAEDITITATDAAGNSSTTTTKAISVDTVAPTIVSIEADSANQQITLTYSADLDDVNAIDTSAFNVVTGNNTNEVVSATVSGAEVILVLTDAFAAGAAIVVGYTDAAGDQATSVQDNAGNDVDTFSSGVVADGYIRGAQIYLDANANGLADADELVTGVITDGLGNFVLSASDNPNGYAIIATGGVNIDTGLPNNTALKAPAGSSVINPITTLIQTVLENNEGTSLDDAKASVNAALGVSTELDLTKFDPISSLNAADNNATEALTVQKAATQVVAIIELATQGKTATEVANDSQTIINNLVDQIVTTETAIDFTDTAVVTSAVTEVTSTLEVADIVQVTQTLQAATSFDEVSQAQAEAFDDISPDAVKSISFDELTKDNTPNVTVTFDVADVSGKAAVSGDTITIEASQGDTTISTEVTLSASNIAQGSVSTSLEDLVDGTYTIKSYITDRVGNTSVVKTEESSLTVDSTSPTVLVTIDDTLVNASDRATVTFTFSEDPLDSISIDDLVATGGTLSNFEGAGTSRTVTFTPNADVEVAGSVSVIAQSYNDKIGNLGVSGSVIANVDSKAPTVTITSAQNSLKAGESTLVTMTFTEAPNADLSLTDFTVTGGILSELTIVDDVAQATFTPEENMEGTASITLAANSFSDLAGNPVVLSNSLDIKVDTQAASLTTELLSAAENSTSVGTIETSETATVTLGTGEDSDLFTLVDGALTLKSPQDFESEQTEFKVAFDLVDAAGNSSSDTMTVNITDVNEAPTVTSIADQIAVVGQAFSLDVKSAFTDVDAGDDLTYSIMGTLPDGIIFEDGVLSGIASTDTEASNITVTATDKSGLSISQDIAISAVSAPVILSIDVTQGDSDIAKTGESLTITATVSEVFTLNLNEATPTLTITLGDEDVVATYASHDGSAKTVTFTATAPGGDSSTVIVKSISLGAATLIGDVSAQPLAFGSVGQSDNEFELDNTAPTAPTITDVTADNVINGAEQTTTLSGTAEANA
ncbi:Ig-like domain-containing protein, partial [Opacimonas viscosa]